MIFWQKVESTVTGLKNEMESERKERIKLERENSELREICDGLQTNNVLLNQSSINLRHELELVKTQLRKQLEQSNVLQNNSLELKENAAQLQRDNSLQNDTLKSLTATVDHFGDDLADIKKAIDKVGASCCIDTCSNSTKGMMKYNEQVKEVEYCNTSHWLTLVLTPGSSFLLPASSCKQIELDDMYSSSHHNGQYWIRPSFNDPPFQVFCDASEGWTLIMKIDGNKQTFDYHSDLWLNKKTFQPNNLDLDDKETKLASYWTLPFTELRLGMKVDGTTRWITFSYTASSLYSLIADGQYRSTSIGESKWRSLLPTSSLQNHCNKEGFNIISDHSYYGPRTSRVRLGFVANEQNECESPDSFVGFGTSYTHGSAEISAGNYACCTPDNGFANTKAIGYVMAR
ncbi:uncharacterized protein LOC134177751 [Corticium candelabrum]|uniref:uncharacterized protein LOC134177751 n=1 Tax=Corticium candelabrum TaxID=121492 RepID=UPI002E265AC4|nr:uncharacterized protein LOC134177751 [Corticium candelabrum]